MLCMGEIIIYFSNLGSNTFT